MFLKLLSPQQFALLDNKPQGIHPVWLMVLTSIWLASLGNIALWQELARLPEMNDWRAAWFGIAFAVLIAALICMLMSLLCWRWTLKPVMALLLTSAALGTYFMLSYRVVIDSSMMVNVLQTDLKESLDLFSWKLVVAVLFLAVIPIVVLWTRPVRQLTVLKTIVGNVQLLLASCIVAAVAVFPIYQDFASSMRNHIQLRYLINPLNSFYGLVQLAIQPLQNPMGTLQAIGKDAKLGSMYTNQPKIPLLVLVVGETARSGNFGINGYSRDTTPLLSAIKKNTDQSGELTTQTDVWSCGTTTATSLPCMFSHLGKSAYENKQFDYENLIDILDKAGLAVIWLENQSGCKGICDRVYRQATSKLNIPEFCSTGECFDEIMLNNLDARLREVPYDKLSKGAVIVMHQMGSHGPAYYKRSPEAIKKFKPECINNALQECSRTELVNAYDNSIAYTDYFLSKVIDYLKSKAAGVQAGMLYVSDHGESLGENNLYLHGLPYAIAPDVQKHIPWISWFANDFIGRHNLDTDCMANRTGVKLSHDNYFHTVLGLMDIQTEVYKSDLDAYAACRVKR
jgi:lipid A ethanolaminephosphotransferase